MASYSDTITKFNPYVEEVPVDLMMKVGMAKQQQYEQGIQKIQSNIDNVAGLDVYNDVDKKYLQSKLDQLGSDLKWVGASDFSDFQLVNSVNGMTNQIAKDENILNAVSSTARVRKGFTDMETAKKAGKSKASNDWMYNEAVNKYANSTAPGQKFGYAYEQAEDFDKALVEKLKAAHADKLAADENYMNADGTINHDLLDHHIKEGLSTSKVLDIARSVYTDPKYARQIQIDGLYNYKDYDAEALLKDKYNAINSQKNLIESQSTYLRSYASLAKGDKRVQALKDIQTNMSTLENLDKQYSDYAELVSKNIDGAKYESYYQNKLQEAVKEYAWTSDEHKVEVNPQFDVNMKKSEFALKQEEFNEKKYMDSWAVKKTKAEIDHMANEDYISSLKISGKLDADGNAIWSLGTPGVNAEENEKKGSSSFYTELDNQITDRNQLFSEITSHIGVSVPWQKTPVLDFYKKDPNTQEWQINPKYLNKDPHSKYMLNETGSKIYNLAKAQMKTKIDATGQLHLTGNADSKYADQIKNWWDMGTVINAQRKATDEAEQEFKPVLSEVEKKADLKDAYNVTYLDHNTETYLTKKISKSILTDAVIYKEGKNIFGEDSDASKQSYNRLKKSLGNINIDDFVDGLKQTNSANISSGSLNAYRNIVNQFKDRKVKDAFVKRENKFKDMQRQSTGQELSLVSAKPEVRESVRLSLLSELETIMKDKSSGSYKVAAQTLEKVKADTGLDNNLYKFRYDDKTGKWYAHISQLGGGEFEEGGAEIQLPKGSDLINKLNSQINPKENLFKNSTFGKILNTRGGFSTISATTNDIYAPGASVSAIERTDVGNYSIGFHAVEYMAGSNSYLPYLYIYDKRAKQNIDAIPLDYKKLAKLPGLSSAEKNALLSQQGIYDSTELVPAITQFKSIMTNPKYSDAAVKLLIGNYNKQ